MRLKFGAARLVFGDPFFGESAGLDLAEDLLHFLFGLRRDDPRPGHELALLGGVGDGMVHPVDAAFVNEVHDQLHFMQALEIGRLPADSRLPSAFHSRS